MSKKNSYLLGIFLTIGIGTLLYYFFCCNCCTINTDTDVSKTVVSKVTKSDFRLNGNGIDYRCESNFNFLNNDFKSIMPVGDSVAIGIENLKNTLLTKKQQITITGYALSSEKNNSVFENLGLARANDVKNYFVTKGIPSNLIVLKGEVKDDLTKDQTTLFGPVIVNLNDIAVDTPTEDWAALRDKINAEPLILYFNTGQTSIDLSESDRKKITEITHYLDNVSDSKLAVVGHTDNVGEKLKNITLGKERADFAKAYLVNNGIASEKIESDSKGPDVPIASNTSAEGKAKNRRVEVKIN